MQKENMVFVVANNKNWLRAMADNLPREEASECKFVMVIEERIGTTEKTIHKLFGNVLEDYDVLTSTEVCEAFASKTGVDTPMLREYSMGMNELSLWSAAHFYDGWNKALFLDDDIILKDGFTKLFDAHVCNAFYRSMFANMCPKGFDDVSDHARDFWRAMVEVSGMQSFSKRFWKLFRKNFFCSGHKLIVRDQFNAPRYEAMLKREFSNDTLYNEFWRNWYENGKDKGYVWYLSEIVDNLFFFDEVNDDLKKDGLVHVFWSQPVKTPDGQYRKAERASLLHMACGQYKAEQYSELEERGIIKC